MRAARGWYWEREPMELSMLPGHILAFKSYMLIVWLFFLPDARFICIDVLLISMESELH